MINFNWFYKPKNKDMKNINKDNTNYKEASNGQNKIRYNSRLIKINEATSGWSGNLEYAIKTGHFKDAVNELKDSAVLKKWAEREK